MATLRIGWDPMPPGFWGDVLAKMADIKREPSGAGGVPADLMTIDELREEVPRLRAMLDAECRVTLELRRRLTATKAST